MINFFKKIESFIAKHQTAVLISLIILIALGLRLKALFSVGDFWFDELVIAEFARRPWNEFFYLLQFEQTPPLYFIIMRLWRTIFGEGENIFRFFSLICSMLTIWPLYLLAKKLFNQNIALITILLFAISPLTIFTSIESRAYALLLLLLTATLFIFLQTIKTNGIKYWIVSFFLITLSLYTHLTALLIFPVFLGILIYQKVDKMIWRNSWITALASLALYLPWLFMLVQRKFEDYQMGLFANDWYGSLSSNTPIYIWSTVNLVFDGFGRDIPIFALATSLAVFIPLVFLAVNYKSLTDEKTSINILLIIVGMSLLIASVFNVYLTKYYVFIVPSLYMLLAFSYSIVLKTLKSIGSKLAYTVICLALLYTSSINLFIKENHNKAVVKEIENEKIEFLLNNPVGALIHYYKPEIKSLNLLIEEFGQKVDPQDYLEYALRYNWNWDITDYNFLQKVATKAIMASVAKKLPELPDKFGYNFFNDINTTDKIVVFELEKTYCSKKFNYMVNTANPKTFFITFEKKSAFPDCQNTVKNTDYK